MILEQPFERQKISSNFYPVYLFYFNRNSGPHGLSAILYIEILLAQIYRDHTKILFCVTIKLKKTQINKIYRPMVYDIPTQSY